MGMIYDFGHLSKWICFQAFETHSLESYWAIGVNYARFAQIAITLGVIVLNIQKVIYRLEILLHFQCVA